MRPQNQCWRLLVEICGASEWNNGTPSFSGWGSLYIPAKTTVLPMGLDTFSVSMKNMEHYCTSSTQA